jgi:hypothetical protein
MKISISALGPTIGEQCAKYGLVAAGKPIEQVDRISHALTLCHIHGMLTDTEVNRGRTRERRSSRASLMSCATPLHRTY